MNLVTRPNTHFRARPENAHVDTLVVHAMGEFIKDGGEEYYAPDFLEHIRLSVHVMIAPDGTIIQCVDPGWVAWHCRKYNFRSVGAEFLVPGSHDIKSLTKAMGDVEDSPYSAEQYEAGGWWYAQQAMRFNLTAEDIKAHSWLDPERKHDPGQSFDWPTFLGQFHRWLTTEAA